MPSISGTSSRISVAGLSRQNTNNENHEKEYTYVAVASQRLETR